MAMREHPFGMYDDKVQSIDAELENADWTKQTFDVLDPKVRNPSAFREWLKQFGKTMKGFKSLPVYKLGRHGQAPRFFWKL